MLFHEWLASLFAPASPQGTSMKMSEDGRKQLIAREGRRLTAYRDTKGILTIGIGHTAAAGAPTPIAGMKITAEQCDAIFARDLIVYEKAVANAVTFPLLPGEFDALVSLCFNIGTGAFRSSTIVKRLNAGDRLGAAEAIMMWKIPPEIIGRRKTEYRQFAMAAGIPQNKWIA